ncbi:putative transposase-like protein [Lasius niger]|uniref:Putative transposase-like protein n=1 Tax=Lasius niger TaxID=67767 RepID=A0A0J7KA42_LASNI|nr:putative transposase-like protein [Lasius niger]
MWENKGEVWRRWKVKIDEDLTMEERRSPGELSCCMEEEGRKEKENKVCVYWAESHSEKIGGEGIIVKIDEAKIGKRKYNRGRLIDGKWIFGGFERNSKKMFIVPVFLTEQQKH